MVLVLYVLAGVMAAGGLASVYSGSDIIVMERGWTMVIAGSVFAASGALLAGIATAVARLQGLESEFARLSERLGRPEESSFASSLASSLASSPAMTGESRSPDPRASPPPLVPVQEIRGREDLDITPEPVMPPPEPPSQAAPELSEPVREPPLPAIATDGDALFDERQPAPEAVAPEVDAEPPPAPTVVGTYNSGGNFYIMYSDGSIEAETPAGKFRFDSLDELKTFIAAGGDKAKATS